VGAADGAGEDGGVAVLPPQEPGAGSAKRGCEAAFGDGKDGDEPPDKKPWKGSLTEFKNLVKKNGIPKNHLQKNSVAMGVDPNLYKRCLISYLFFLMLI